MNIWNTIVDWFRDRSERSRVISSFNESARQAYMSGDAPVMLKAKISRGDPNYAHEFSARWSGSGFRVMVFTGGQLSRAELEFMGNVILADEKLVRRLIVLGWDTLEIHGSEGVYGLKWRLTDFTTKINLINGF